VSYASTTDLLALFRQTKPGGVRSVRMPGLDYVIAAMARAAMFQVWIAETPPTVDQITTLWLQPASPNSWASEGTVWLWDVITAEYQLATPELWSALFAGGADPGGAGVFQLVAGAVGIVNVPTTLLAVQRVAPVTTVLELPPVAGRKGLQLQIVDWSTAVTGHTITLTPNGAETVMQLASFDLLSTADQLAGVTLYPSIDLAGWVIAP
jgi:hypothetical protein